MGKYESLAKKIVKEVGGKENINTVTHCITRLRFKLKDESLANENALKELEDVITVVRSGGQYQVVVGNKVSLVYQDVCGILGFSEENQGEQEEAPKGIVNKFIDIISACFAPILGPLVACGIIKGLNALLVFLLGSAFSASGTYLVLNAIGDSMFYFMPVLLGYAAAKKFNVNVVVGMLIGASLCYPSIQAKALASGEALGAIGILGDYYTTFLNIPMIATDYTSSVIPVIVVVAFASFIEKKVKQRIPELIQNFFVPFLVLIISLPVGLLIIGPLVELFTNALSYGFTAMFDFSPVITGIILGFIWQVLIIFGLHWSAVPVAMINLSNMGYDTLLMVTHPAAFAQTAALFAMFLKMKDKKKKMLSLPAIVSGLCGVTEPSIYGYTLAAKKPFIASMIGAAVGNGMMCVLGVKRYIMGAGGVFGMVNYISPEGDVSGVVMAALSIIVAMAISFLLTFVFWKDDSEKHVQTVIEHKGGIMTITSPIEGEIIALKDVKDEAFSSGGLGKGVAIIPHNGRITAPLSGVVTALFPTLHAIGITGDNGIELLIHVGIDTVNLNGKGFKACVSQGDAIVVGQTLLEVDIAYLKENGYEIQTPIIITNSNQYTDVIIEKYGMIKTGNELMKIIA